MINGASWFPEPAPCPPSSWRRRVWRSLLWTAIVVGGGAVVIFVLLHVAPATGAAGGCGGG
jgi:hypothetical protein